MHPLVRELVALLPGDGEPFPEPARKRWVIAIEAAVELLYGEGDDDQPPARARHRALPATDLGDYAAEYQTGQAEPAGDHSPGTADYATDYPPNYPADPANYAAEYSADYATEYRTDPADPRAEADDQRWRHSADPALGATYSSYTWDTSTP